ncbi:MAG TPA: ABC transporter permease, partial [Candidatus Limnocylindrales bacterium]|nr:ABC transporter permease [Candidatus Limnocylindrales bacterium]
MAFPLIFVILFGSIFSGGNSVRSIGFADLDGSAASAQLRQAFGSIDTVKLVDGNPDDLLARMKKGDVSAVIVAPKGYGATVAARSGPADVTVYTDPSQSSADAATRQLVGFVLSAVNQAATGLPPAVAPTFHPVQTNDLSFISYLVPSILGMS